MVEKAHPAPLSFRSLPLRDRWVLLLVTLLLVLNRGFSVVLVPPGIPVAELTLALYLVFINWKTLIPRLFRDLPLAPYAVWWGFGTASCLYYARRYGFWAFRDAGFVLDSLFLIIGYAFARSEERILLGFRWLRISYIIAALYALTRPFAGDLIDLIVVPGITNGFVLGWYITDVPAAILAALSIYTFPPRRTIFRQLAPLVFAAIIADLTLVFQLRSLYILLAVAGIMLLVWFPKQAWRYWLAPVVFLVALLAINVSGVEVSGRLGDVSPEFFYQHILSLTGNASGAAAEAAANGILLRYGWWHAIIADWLASAKNFFLGTGFGQPLTSFSDPFGNIARDPHNSYLSILGRMGLLGAIPWLWITGHLIYRWNLAFRKAKAVGSLEMRSHLLVCLGFFVTCWITAYGEPVFEFPFFTIPYYFMAGLCIRYLRAAQEQTPGPPDPRNILP